MRTLLLATGFLLVLGLAALATAGDAEAAPIGGTKLSIAPDVFIGFGSRCKPRPRRVYVVRRYTRAPTYVRPTYVYRPYTYSYAYPRVRIGFGYGHYGYSHHRHYRSHGHHGHYGYRGHHRGHGSRRVIGRRR